MASRIRQLAEHDDGGPHADPVLARRTAEAVCERYRRGPQRRRIEELSRASQERLQASARLATVGEMASLLSHELTQPLAAIASKTPPPAMLLIMAGRVRLVAPRPINPAPSTPESDRSMAPILAMRRRCCRLSVG